jgi:hypothetical protein
MESNTTPEQSTGGDMPDAGTTSSIWGIMTGVFTSPSKAFQDFNQKPRILIPLIVVLVMNLVFAGLTAKYSAQLQYDMMKTSTTLPPQVLDQMEANVEDSNPITGSLGGGIAAVAISLIIALLAWGIGSFVFGGDSKFKKVWGVFLLGSIIFGVGNLLKLPLMIAKDSMYVSFGLAALFPDKDFTSILFIILSFIDAFMIWSIIVEGIGCATVFGISRGKGYATAIIVSLLMTAVYIGFMVIGMSFAGVEITFL